MQEHSDSSIDLVAFVVKVHDLAGDGVGSRFSISGPELDCGGHATNSPFSSRSSPPTPPNMARSRRRTGMSISPGACQATISNCDGASAEARSGCGTTLIARTIERQFRGSVTFDWQGRGLVVRVRAATAMIAR